MVDKKYGISLSLIILAICLTYSFVIFVLIYESKDHYMVDQNICFPEKFADIDQTRKRICGEYMGMKGHDLKFTDGKVSSYTEEWLKDNNE